MNDDLQWPTAWSATISTTTGSVTPSAHATKSVTTLPALPSPSAKAPVVNTSPPKPDPQPTIPVYDMEAPVITSRYFISGGCQMTIQVTASDNVAVTAVYAYVGGYGKLALTDRGGAWAVSFTMSPSLGNLLTVNMVAVDAMGNGNLQPNWLMPTDCK